MTQHAEAQKQTILAEQRRKEADTQRQRAEDNANKAEKRRQEADTQRQRAEKGFQDAQEAVERMLDRVGKERLVNEPRMERVRQELLEDALRFYERFRKEKNDDPGLRFQTARAFLRVGDIRQMLGQPDLAAEAFRSGQGLLEGLTRQFPDRGEYALGLARAHERLGELLRGRDSKQSAQEYSKAIELSLDLVRKIAEEGGALGWAKPPPSAPPGCRGLTRRRSSISVNCRRLSEARPSLCSPWESRKRPARPSS